VPAPRRVRGLDTPGRPVMSFSEWAAEYLAAACTPQRGPGSYILRHPAEPQATSARPSSNPLREHSPKRKEKREREKRRRAERRIGAYIHTYLPTYLPTHTHTYTYTHTYTRTYALDESLSATREHRLRITADHPSPPHLASRPSSPFTGYLAHPSHQLRCPAALCRCASRILDRH
jgi:hypothetical protein